MRKSLALAVILIFACSSVCFAKVVKQYFPNKKVYSTQTYNKKGEVVGPYMVYWPNGRLKEKTFYKSGRPYMTHKWAVDGTRIQ